MSPVKPTYESPEEQTAKKKYKNELKKKQSKLEPRVQNLQGAPAESKSSKDESNDNDEGKGEDKDEKCRDGKQLEDVPDTWNQRAANEGFGNPAFKDGKCHVLSANLRRCGLRLGKLLKFISNLNRPPDVILVQDPPLEFAYQGLGPYDRWYRVKDNLPLTDEHVPVSMKPGKRREQRQKKVEAETQSETDSRELVKVAVMIHNTLPNWRVDEASGKNEGILTTLSVGTRSGTYAFHNLYNYEKTVDLDGLNAALQTATEAHILAGDFNMGHPWWAGSVKQATPKAKKLAKLLRSNRMALKNTTGTATYGRAKRGRNPSGKYETVIDLVFVQNVIKNNVGYKLFIDVEGFESDHAISHVTVKMEIERPNRSRYMWRQTPREDFNKFVEEKLVGMFGTDDNITELKDRAAAEAMLKGIVEVVVDAAREFVPVAILSDRLHRRIFRTQNTHNPQTDEAAQKPDLSKLQTSGMQNPSVQPCRSKSAGGFSRHGMLEVTLNNAHKFFARVKHCETWTTVKQTRRTPDFVVGEHIIQTIEGKVEAFVNAIWKDGSAKKTVSCAPSELHRPHLNSSRKQLPSSGEVTVLVVEHIIRDTSKGKAYGSDGVSFDALKMCKGVISPYLAHLFNKLLALGLHPDDFKDTITVAIRKPGKPANEPKSYRPIALLPCIGKILERIVANRIKELVQKNELLPGVQFGAPGRSATQALEYMINWIHKSWLCGLMVTVFGLDLTGAYDHVNREKLLQILVDMGFPDWIILFLWSFLSNRRTVMRLAGDDDVRSEEYWINVGIPQGSPLSPLLFLFYAASLVQKDTSGFSEGSTPKFAFVDDTYILLAGRSRKFICRDFVTIHELLLERARPLNFTFSPAKYHVFHLVKPGTNGMKEALGCQMLPGIPEFENVTPTQLAKICPRTLKILGVIFDKRLTFMDHIEEIGRRVRMKLSIFRQRMSGPTWGANFEKNRTYWSYKLFATFSHAAGAWFIYDPDMPKLTFGLNSDAIQRLRSIQIDCIRDLTGSRYGTDNHALRAEMHIHDIVLALYSSAMQYRCRLVTSNYHKQLHVARFNHLPFSGKRSLIPILLTHPYQHLQRSAFEYVVKMRDDLDLDKRTFSKIFTTERGDSQNDAKRFKITKNFWFKKLMELSSKQWDEHKRKRAEKQMYLELAYKPDFHDSKLPYYYSLDRAQATMAIQLRTGNILLKGHPIARYALGILNKDRFCPHCPNQEQTAKHLLCYCPSLAEPRQFIWEECGHCDFEKLLTEEIEFATAWAIQYFGIEQFERARKKQKYQFPRARQWRVRGQGNLTIS